jgi:hypothetical protein
MYAEPLFELEKMVTSLMEIERPLWDDLPHPLPR